MRMRFDWAIGSTVMGMPRCCSPKGADMRLLLALPLLAFALPAAAQTTPQAADIPYVTPLGQPPISTMVVEPVAMMLAACDADGDPGVTRDEARACLARSFASTDTTGAGSLGRSAEPTYEHQTLTRIAYAASCQKQTKNQ